MRIYLTLLNSILKNSYDSYIWVYVVCFTSQEKEEKEKGKGKEKKRKNLTHAAT